MNPHPQEIDVDVAVVGAGPAGLAAALAAARTGAVTAVIDTYGRAGGQYYRQPGRPALTATKTQRVGRELIDQCHAEGVQMWQDTSVWSAHSDESGATLETWSSAGLRTAVHAKSAVVAVGAHERFVPIPGWTLPGVISAGAAQTFLKEQGLATGPRVVLGGTGPLQLVVAAQLARAGVRIPAVFELAHPASFGMRHPRTALVGSWRQGHRILEGADALVVLASKGTRVRTGWALTEILGAERVTGVRAARIGRDGTQVPSSAVELECDAVVLHASLVPNTELLRLLGARMTTDPSSGQLIPMRSDTLETTTPGVFAAGDGTGVGGVDLSLVEGRIAGGAAAANAAGTPFVLGAREQARLQREQRFQLLYSALFTFPASIASKLETEDTVMCRCEGVTAGQIDGAVSEGACTSWLVKAVTRAGMGPCQGRMCMPAIEDRLRAAGQTSSPLGRAVRAPLTPIPLSALGGHHAEH